MAIAPQSAWLRQAAHSPWTEGEVSRLRFARWTAERDDLDCGRPPEGGTAARALETPRTWTALAVALFEYRARDPDYPAVRRSGFPAASRLIQRLAQPQKVGQGKVRP